MGTLKSAVSDDNGTKKKGRVHLQFKLHVIACSAAFKYYPIEAIWLHKLIACRGRLAWWASWQRWQWDVWNWPQTQIQAIQKPVRVWPHRWRVNWDGVLPTVQQLQHCTAVNLWFSWWSFMCIFYNNYWNDLRKGNNSMADYLVNSHVLFCLETGCVCSHVIHSLIIVTLWLSSSS